MSSTPKTKIEAVETGPESELPEGWVFAALGEGLIDDVQPGFPCGEHNREGTGIAHLRPMNVTVNGTIDLEDLKYVARKHVDGDEKLIQSGDVLFNNTNSPELVGKTAHYALPEPRAFSNHMTRLRCRNEVLQPRYCALALHHLWQLGYFQNICNNHVSQASVSRTVLLETQIPLPPVVEQQRICSKVYELTTRIGNPIRKLSRARQLAQAIRHAILAAACSGKLTQEWRQGRKCESAKQLLRRICGNASFAPDPEDLEGADELPPSWEWVRCEALCVPSRAITYGVIKLGATVERGVQTLRSSDVRWLHIETDHLKSISRKIADNYSRTYLRGGEIVVTVRGTLGGVAVVPGSLKGCNISREVAVLPVRTEVDRSFTAFAIASPRAQKWLLGETKGVAYTGVNIRDLKRLPVPVPPLVEQQEIVCRVEALFKLADTIEKRVAVAIARAEHLTQAVLAKAFRGELVATEAELARRERRDYEPASVLLERIRQERERSTSPSGRIAQRKRKARAN